MGIGTTLGIIGGGIASAGIGAAASSSAAGAQANAATNAANLQSQNQQASLAEQAREFNTQQQNLAPWLQTGKQSLGELANLLGVGSPTAGAVGGGTTGGAGNVYSAVGSAPAAANRFGVRGPTSLSPIRSVVGPSGQVPVSGGVGAGGAAGLGGAYGSLLQGFNTPFVAPTAAQAAATPGYQFQLQQGEQAIQNSAAAQGGLISGNTLQALDQYSQGLASTNYQQVYNNAIQQYQQAYNIFQGNQANTFNRLAALSGVGQTAATTLGSLGQSAATNIANINATAGGQIGNSLQNAGAARASGYAGIANSLTGGIGSISQYLLLQQLLGNGGGSNPYGYGPGQTNPESYPANYPY